ncbi:MAG: alpha/beta fold hydrolase [Actinobacteria bacterium]|nr:alpha/beta fold hydrolase [Actinomycetota bacterium]
MAWVERPDGCRLYLETHGDPSREPMVLLEGMGGDLPGWRRNLPRLAAELHVAAFDHRGNGRSDAPDEPQSMGTFVADTIAVMDHLGLPTAHLYGMSFGGMVALELCLAHPQRVRTLILGATHFGGPRVVRTRESVPKDRPFLALYSERFAARHPDRVREDLLAGARRRQKDHARRRQWEAATGYDVYDRLPEVAVPTLVLHGTKDRMTSVENARILAERIPRAELVTLEGAGHVYHSEQPDRADAAVLDFVRRHRP